MVDDLFNVLLDVVCQYFVENFIVYVLQRYWPKVFFLCCVFIWFWDRMMLASLEEFGSLPSVWIFSNSLWRIGVSSSLNAL